MIWVIIFLAFFLRLITLNQSLWLDEADNIVASRMFDFVFFITKYPIGDYHPPGYFALIWIWTHLFGFSEIAVRIPSVFLGVGAVAFTYLLGIKIFERKAALVAALLLAIAPLHVYYSQEARMYSLAAFSVIASMYFFIRLEERNKWIFLGYAASAALVFYSDYVAYFIFPAQMIFLLWAKRPVRRWLFSLGLSILVFLPWLLILPQQFLVGSQAASAMPEWKRVAGGADLKNIALVFVKTIFGRISFDNKILYAFLTTLIGVLYGFTIWRGIRRIDDGVKLTIASVFIPLLLAFLVSNYIPMLSYFRMIFILPIFYLLMAKGVLSIPSPFLKPVLCLFIGVSTVSLGIYYLNPKFQREDWRGATKFINEVSSEESVVLFEDRHVKFPFLYYQEEKVAAFGGLKNVQATSEKDVKNIEDLSNKRNQVYLFEYLVEITDPRRLLQKSIKQSGFVEKDVYNFNGVGLIRFYEKN